MNEWFGYSSLDDNWYVDGEWTAPVGVVYVAPVGTPLPPVWIAPAGRPSLRYRLVNAARRVWRLIDRRDPWRHWQTLGFIDETGGRD